MLQAGASSQQELIQLVMPAPLFAGTLSRDTYTTGGCVAEVGCMLCAGAARVHGTSEERRGHTTGCYDRIETDV